MILLSAKNSHQSLVSKRNADRFVGCITSGQQLLIEQYFQYSKHIVNFTFVFHWYQYDLLSLKYEVNEWETKSFIGGKQLQEGKAVYTYKGKLWCTVLNVDKLELLFA